MNITPIEMQIVVPKATEVGKVQHQQDHESVLQQDVTTEQMKQAAQQKMTQVQNSEKSEGQKIRRDGKNKGGGQGQQPGKRQEKEQDEEESVMAVDTYRGQRIDIKL